MVKEPGTPPVTDLDGSIRVEEEIGRTSPADFPTLSRVADRLDTEAEIGRGGAVRVFRILDRTLNRRCAMKVLGPELAKEDPAVAFQFVREAQITGQLDHPNIVPVHSLGTLESGALCFTMKLVNGETLTQRLAPLRNEPRRPDWIAEYLDIFVKVCDAVAFAHHHGIIHCDVKPDNVMVGDYGQVYMMDWGVARRLRDRGVTLPDPDRNEARPADAPSERSPVGTLDFMSPEQGRGETARMDERSDVFSLGALLYFILCGRSPYEGLDDARKLEAVRRGQVTPIEAAPTSVGLSLRLRDLTTRALAPDPDDRHRTVADLKSELLECVRGAPELPWRTYKTGEHVVREGETSNAAYVIRKGTCQVYKTVDGQKLVVRTMGPDEVFGELGILSSKPRTASVVALEDLTVELVDATKLRDGVGLHTWLGPFISALVDRFREVDDRLSVLEHGKARDT
jgi:serine/threonine-protein kinase